MTVCHGRLAARCGPRSGLRSGPRRRARPARSALASPVRFCAIYDALCWTPKSPSRRPSRRRSRSRGCRRSGRPTSLRHRPWKSRRRSRRRFKGRRPARAPDTASLKPRPWKRARGNAPVKKGSPAKRGARFTGNAEQGVCGGISAHACDSSMTLPADIARRHCPPGAPRDTGWPDARIRVEARGVFRVLVGPARRPPRASAIRRVFPVPAGPGEDFENQKI